MNIYAPNDQTQQVKFLRDLSTSALNQVVNEKVLLGGDFNCALSDLDKRGGHSFESKKAVIKEISEMKNTFDLVDMWRQKHPSAPGFTWSNVSLKIQCRLDYLFASQNLENLITDCQIISNIFSDHSALQLYINPEKKNKRSEAQDFGSLITHYLQIKNNIELITKSIPTFLRKYKDVTDKGLFWEMVKMEIRATTIVFAKQKRDEEKDLLQQFSNLQEKL